jgi:hypothetical protein
MKTMLKTTALTARTPEPKYDRVGSKVSKTGLFKESI